MAKQLSIEQVIKATIAEHGMLPAQPAPLVLMVSGGSDSVAMTRFFANRPLIHILHINHLLRGADSDGDEQFVRNLAAELDVPCTVRRVDVAALAAAQTNGNAEAIGRDVRYAAAEELLDELCDAAGVERSAGRIATAHTLDDRAEMFYMRTIVGGGTGSLASIPYVSGSASSTAAHSRVIRPLLDCTRTQLRAWLTPEPWREDASNADTSKLRAFVRHELLPLALQRNPELLATLKRTMDLLADDADILDAQAAELYEKYVEPENDSSDLFIKAGEQCSLLQGQMQATSALTIDLALFEDAGVPLALRRRVIKLALDAQAVALGQQPRQEFRHIDAIARHGCDPGFALHVAGGIEVRAKRKVLVIQAAKPSRQKALQ